MYEYEGNQWIRDMTSAFDSSTCRWRQRWGHHWLLLLPPWHPQWMTPGITRPGENKWEERLKTWNPTYPAVELIIANSCRKVPIHVISIAEQTATCRYPVIFLSQKVFIESSIKLLHLSDVCRQITICKNQKMVNLLWICSELSDYHM